MELRRSFILLTMKRPKLLYTPGLISLLVVPVLFYFLQPPIKKQTVISILVPKEDHQSSYGLGFSRVSVTAALKSKKINTVYFDGDHKLNARKLEFVAKEALKLKFYHDTTQVIKVRLSAETTYNEFVQLVNIMHKDSHKRYALLDDDFYIFGEEPPELELPPIPYQCLLCNDVIHTLKIQPATTWQDKLWEHLNHVNSFIRNNALLLSAFVILIIVPVILKRKTRQLRKSL
jgi:biopolymer transport protein ExbD